LFVKLTTTGKIPLVGFALIFAFKEVTLTTVIAEEVPHAFELETLTVPPFVLTTEPVLELFDQV